MKFNRTAIFLIVACAVFSTDLLQAQVRDSGFALEEVVVTARKREENLQSTPISISAFTSNELAQRQIRSTDQLADATPNLTFDSYAPSSGNNASSQIYIRGIGQSDFTAVTDPGVGLYVDGVYYARSIGGNMGFLDLERIEVLRGPQGTLFGRNTIGGAIALHTRRPDNELAGSAEVEVGSDKMLNGTAHLNIPIAEGLYSSLGITKRTRDGYVKRVQLAERQLSGVALPTDGKLLGDDDSFAARGAIVWEASDTLNFFMTADYTNNNENGSPATSLGLNEQQTFPYHVNTFENGQAFGGNCPMFPPPTLPEGERGTNNNFMCLNDTWYRNVYESEGTAEITSELTMWGISLEASWEATEWLAIKSISAYRNIDAYSARDGDGTPYRVFHTQDPFDQHQFSQELQFSGSTDKLKWLMGLYYFEEKADNPNPVQLPDVTVGAIISGGKANNDNFAVFSQVTYDFTNKWSLTGGLRFTDETKRFTPYSTADGFYVQGGPGSPNVLYYDCPTGQEPGCNGVNGRRFLDGQGMLPPGEYERSFDDWTPMVNVAYQATDDLMAYATYSEGFKSGGFDQRFIFGNPNGPSSFEPETATTYEVGMKSSWADNTFRLNLAAFFTDYEDMHIIVRQDFAPITFNAGKAEIKGFELESTWVPTPAWIIQANVGYIDAEYITLDESVKTVGITLDHKLPQTAEWTGNLGIAYTHQFAKWSVTPRVDWSYTDDVYNNAENTPQLMQDAYDLVNASITLMSEDGAWEFMLGGRNLGDKTILVAGSSAYGTGSGYLEGTFAREREWSFSAKYSF